MRSFVKTISIVNFDNNFFCKKDNTPNEVSFAGTIARTRFILLTSENETAKNFNAY